MVLLAIITSVFVAIQDPIIQKFAVRFAGGFLSEKTGADIKVGRIAVSPDLRLFVDNLTVKDLNGNDLAKIGRLRAKAFVGELLEGKIHLRNVELSNTDANLITYEGEDKMNFAFLLEAFPSDTTKEKTSKPTPIIIDRISLKNIDFMLWNQNKARPEKTEKHLMDYAHLKLDDINLEASDFFMMGDSIHANIENLSATELSGLVLESFQSDVTVSSNGIFLDKMVMATNNSRFDMDLNMLYHGFDDFGSFVDSVVFDATIRPTDVMLSDIGVFTDVMYKMPNRVKFEGRFTGPIEHFRVDDIKVELGQSTSFQGSISMHPLDFENGYHTLNIKNMQFNYDDLANFCIPSSTETIPIPESLKPMGDSRLSLDFKGSYNDFKSNITLNSDIGDVEASIMRTKDAKGDNHFGGYLIGDRIKAGLLANATKYVGDLDLNADFTAKLPQKGNPELSIDGKITKIKLLGKNIDEIKLDGAMEQNMFKGVVKVDDDDMGLDFNGLIDFQNPKFPKSDFEAVIRDADLSALQFMKGDSISKISTRIYANMSGFNIDDLEGSLRLDSTLYQDSRGSYFMQSFNASIENDNLMERRIRLDSDFFDFEMAGKMNFSSLLPVFKTYVDTYMEIPLWDDELADFEKYKMKHDTEQEFIVNLTLKDTKTLSRLLMPSLQIAKNTTLTGTFTSRSNILNLTLRSSKVQIGKLNFNNLELRNADSINATRTFLKLDEIRFSNVTETDTLDLGLENFSIVTRMRNDTLFARLKWDDKLDADRNKAHIETYFHPHESGGIFSITQGEVCINDSVWTVSPNNFINLTGQRELISNMMFSHNRQFIRVDGYVPMNDGDTISLQMRDFDISNLDFYFLSKGFNLDGLVSGNATVSTIKTNPMLLADLDVVDLCVNADTIGDAKIESVWDNANRAVKLNANIFDKEKRMLNAYGSYYTDREDDNLDFTVSLDSLRLAAASPFLTGVVSRLQGVGTGEVLVTGSLQQPNISGKVTVNDGGCKVNYLNTFYTFSPTILVDNSTISFKNLVLTDTLGNSANVEGQINHNRFKDFDLDLRIHPRDFLALATTGKDNDTFYGTAVANGLITVKGPFDDISLDIKALTRKGTYMTIPLNRVSKVRDNDFIVFVNPDEESEEEDVVEAKPKSHTNFALGLDVNATKDATLKIILPADLGTIEAAGNGNVKLGMSTKEDLTMFGNYTIESGHFLLNFKNLVTRNFSLQPGGVISWSGSPTDGRINATGVYSVKGSLSDLGADVDTTSSTNSNVNVECLIHLKDALLNPTISFGMRLPNANEDIQQAVYSLIDTTNQAVMTQQVLSLLVLGKFAYAGGSSSMGQNFDVASLFSGKMQLDITNHLNLGVSYHSGSIDSYDEYQIALRTELFENRLTIETNLGLMSSNSGSDASNIVGEFDLYYKLSEDGRLQVHFYNHSNYNSNFNSFAIDRRAPYTQGLGLSYSKSFDNFRNLFRKNTPRPNQPLIVPKKQENN